MKRNRLLVYTSLLILLTSGFLFSDNAVYNRTTFTIALGYNTYSPGMNTRYKMYPEGFDSLGFGGFTMNFRVLVKTRMLNSRLNLGFEFGWLTLAAYKGSILYYPSTKEYVTQYDSGWPWQFLAGYLIHGSEKFFVHGVLGFGGVNVSDIDYEFGTELAGSAKIILGIPVGSFISIDPEVGILFSLGKSKLTSIYFLVGLSFNMNKLFNK